MGGRGAGRSVTGWWNNSGWPVETKVRTFTCGEGITVKEGYCGLGMVESVEIVNFF